MARRFSRLDYALALLRNPTATSTPAPEPPAGSALHNYYEYATRAKKITINRSSDSLPETYVDVTLQPFGLPVNVANEYKVDISQRVADNLANVGNAALYHHKAVTETHKYRLGFIPAKAIVNNVGTTTTTPTSQITGLRYKTKGGKSYTIPFGAATATEAFEVVVQSAIAAGIAALADKHTVSFTPEIFKERT